MMNTIDGMTTRAETAASTRYPFLQPTDSMTAVMTGLMTTMYTELTVQAKPMARPAFFLNIDR